jgi:hypothetical protein
MANLTKTDENAFAKAVQDEKEEIELIALVITITIIVKLVLIRFIMMRLKMIKLKI